MNEIMLSSGLFEENSKGDIVDIDDNYDEVLTEFYKTYPYVDANKDHFSSYEDAKRKSGLFHEVSDGVFVVNEDVSELDLGIFYSSQLYNAKVSLFNYSDYKNYYDYNNNLIYWGSIGCIVLSSAIFYLILPLCLKGKSIGRLIFKMELLSQDDKPASIIQRIVRYIAFLMIVVLMSFDCCFYCSTFVFLLPSGRLEGGFFFAVFIVLHLSFPSPRGGRERAFWHHSSTSISLSL